MAPGRHRGDGRVVIDMPSESDDCFWGPVKVRLDVHEHVTGADQTVGGTQRDVGGTRDLAPPLRVVHGTVTVTAVLTGEERVDVGVEFESGVSEVVRVAFDRDDMNRPVVMVAEVGDLFEIPIKVRRRVAED